MEIFQVALIFALVLQCFGQGPRGDYAGRTRPARNPNPVVPSSAGSQAAGQPNIGLGAVPGAVGFSDPMFDGANIPLSDAPQWIRDLEGSTITGRAMMGGQGILPEHGGLGNDGDYSNGLREGWGADRRAPMPASLANWIRPNGVRHGAMVPNAGSLSQPSGAQVVGFVPSQNGLFDTPGRLPLGTTNLAGAGIDNLASATSGTLGGVIDFSRPWALRTGAGISPGGASTGIRRAVGFIDTNPDSYLPLGTRLGLSSRTVPVSGPGPLTTGTGSLSSLGGFDIYGNRVAG